MISAWRIVKARYQTDAFDGEGARQLGGRWSSPGSPVVYTSGSAALAALEMLVHLGRSSILSAYVVIGCSFSEALITSLDRAGLPANWRAYPARPELPLLGDEWLRSGASAVLEVPSAVVETESNYLLNPQHRDFRAIQLAEARAFEFDPRLFGL